MSKHTPGPWWIESRARTAINKGPKHIAMVNFYNGGNEETDVREEEHEANVHLIAAAPDLLEACQALIKKIYNLADKYNDRSCDYDVCEEIRQARTAIAKTEGKAR
jgi:hypothetical protein